MMNNHFCYPGDVEHGPYQSRPESNISMASSSNATPTYSHPPTVYSQSSSEDCNSRAISHEIHRFESVHPSIYAIYDLLEMIGGTDGQLIAQRIRDHVVCIEDSFVNSQEWTLSRAVPDLRLGVVGTIQSGKSALVHRYLTGTYLQDESPEGGRFKKEVTIDGQSYLLLIRDEGGLPEAQFSCWADAVLFVYNTENESSFNEIFTFYNKFFHLRLTHDIPIFLIGITDAISNPSSHSIVVDQSRAKKLAMELKNCIALEANPVLGLNVDNVFHQACQQMITARNNIENSPYSRPTTPKSPYARGPLTPLSNVVTNNRFQSLAHKPHSPLTVSSPGETHHGQQPQQRTTPMTDEFEARKSVSARHELSTPPPPPPQHKSSPQVSVNSGITTPTGPLNKPSIANKPKNLKLNTVSSPATAGALEALASAQANATPAPAVPKRTESMRNNPEGQFKMPLPPTPSNLQDTPERDDVVQRKNRRKSNIFTPLSKKNSANTEEKLKNGEVGVGRAIPIKQGFLYKKSKKTLNKDWRKKYVTLTTNGCLTYHPTLHDYMNDVHGKNISLKHTTVKIPGGKPRVGRQSVSASPSVLDSNDKLIPSTNPKYENNKKRSRKLKSIGIKSDSADVSDGNEFVIVSLDNKQWLFNALNSDDREDWMNAIEQQILSSLQNTECDKAKVHNVNGVDDQTIQSIKNVPGNSYCADCSAKDPEWASLNLGTMICIDCSGIHRKIGTHISKVRSLTLDVWPSSHVAVMLGLGNTAANRIWEANLAGTPKPSPTSGHEEKEKFIRAKYETKQFLAPLPDTTRSIDAQIFDAIATMDIKLLALLLAHLTVEGTPLNSVKAPDFKTPLHFAAKVGSLEITQLLLWYNINEKDTDDDGKTALSEARGHREIEELLIQSGCTFMSVPLDPVSDRTSTEQSSRRDGLRMIMRGMDQFNKLHTSII